MPPPEPLREFVDGARSYVTRASWIDGVVLAENARRFLSNGLVFVAPVAAADRAYEEADARIRDLRDELAVADWGTWVRTSLRMLVA